VIIDEFAHMTQQVLSGTNPLAHELDEFINTYMRQHTIWFTAAHQELYQIDEQLRNTLLSLGTYILGSTSSMQSARDLADALYCRNPFRVKDAEPIYGRLFPNSPLEVIDVRLHFLPLEEQTELFAQRIKKLGRYQFLFRPAVAEGHIGSEVLSMTIRDVDRDRQTGEYQFPDAALMQRVRAALAQQSGIPIKKLLTEQETRVPQAFPETTQPLTLPQPGRRRPQRHNGAKPGAQEASRPVATSTPPPVLSADTARTAPDQALPHAPLQRRHRLSAADGNDHR
jgi:hypothetical protein